MKRRNNITLLVKLGLIASSYAFAIEEYGQNLASLWPLDGQPSHLSVQQSGESPLFPENGDVAFSPEPAPQKTNSAATDWNSPPSPLTPPTTTLPGQSTLFFSLESTPKHENSPSTEQKLKNRKAPVALKDDPSFFSLNPEIEIAQETEKLNPPAQIPLQSDTPQVKAAPSPAIQEPQPVPVNNESKRSPVVAPPIPQQNGNVAQPSQKTPSIPSRNGSDQSLPKSLLTAQPAQKSSISQGTATPLPTLINFNNISIIEYIRFISRITGKNFVFNEDDLQFNITIISEEPTSLENIMTALLQEIRIHDLEMIEQGNSIIIHRNPRVNAISKVVSDDFGEEDDANAEIVTQVFRLNTLEPIKAATIIRPLMSENALIETLSDPNQLIITDLVSNVSQINKLLKSLDAPNGGLVIGQFVAHITDINTLMPLAQQIMQPISQDQPLILVPYTNTNSIFIVSSPFLVERTISILQHLDQERAKTRIIDLNELKFQAGTAGTSQAIPQGARGGATGPVSAPTTKPGETGGAVTGSQNGWQYGPGAVITPSEPGLDLIPLFIPVEVGGKEGAGAGAGAGAALPPSVGYTHFRLEEPVPVVKITRKGEPIEAYIPAPSDRMKFYLHKLQYRKGDAVMEQVQQIASSLQDSPGHDDLMAIINTMQWLQDSKSLVFTGTPQNIEKLKDLVEQIDIPLRQVYIEMLILQTTMDEELQFGVNWGQRFGGGHQAGSQGFQAGVSPLQGTLDSAGVTQLGGSFPNINTGVPFNNALVPNPNPLGKNDGFNLGVLGQHIIHKGLGIEFNSIGALVHALHDRNQNKIIQTPRIITEDGVPAQIFVGINTPFKTQSISNDIGGNVTNNFEFRDVGTSLQVTPYLHNSDIVTLEVVQEVSSVAGQNTTGTGSSTQIIGPTTNKNSTKTTIHMPDGYFVIMSGMMENDQLSDRRQVPCLGGIPVLGAGFSFKREVGARRNLMIFIRPLIIDTDEQYQNITRHQQDIYKVADKPRKSWVYETEEALDFLNLRRTYNVDDEDDEEYHFAH